MSKWSQINVIERIRPTIKILSSFHDYALGIIIIILFFVAGVSIFIVRNSLIRNSPIITVVEVIWTVVPIFILIFLVVPSLKILYLSEERDPFLTLKVIGHQWYWSYDLVGKEFESYIASASTGDFRLLEADHRVVLPVNKDARVLISASDVLHCWTVPRLGVKADAVPGRLNQLRFNIIRPSIIYGQCSEICGANHRFMPINVEAITFPFFLKWLCGGNIWL